MISPPQSTLKFACPSCKAKYEVPASMAGKRGPCAKCGVEVEAPNPKPARKLAAEPEYIPVECRVCNTRFYGTFNQVGKELKCPDCGARNILQPPPEVREKKPLAVLDGEQYELYSVEEQPLPAELVARQQKFIAVHCLLCDTLMHGTLAQVGQTIRCPDCNTENVVPPPPEEPRSKLLTTGADLEIDTRFDPGEPPPVIVPPVRRMLFEEEAEEAERKRREGRKGKSAKKGEPAAVDKRGRPVMPKWPLVSGILPFLFYPNMPTRWMALALTLLPIASIGFDGLAGWLSFAPQTGAGGQAAIMGTIEIVLAAIFASVWTAYASAAFLAIVTESSEGHEQIYEWPTANIGESIPELGFLLVTTCFSPAIGALIGFAFLDVPQSILCSLVSSWLTFPIVLLSQLAGSSAAALLNGRILGSMFRCPFSWLLLYVESAVIAVICGATFLAAAWVHPMMIGLAAPVFIAGMLLYARLMGRLAWRIAEAMPLAAENAA